MVIVNNKHSFKKFMWQIMYLVNRGLLKSQKLTIEHLEVGKL
jgi:hypothetical protein